MEPVQRAFLAVDQGWLKADLLRLRAARLPRWSPRRWLLQLRSIRAERKALRILDEP